MFTKNDLPNWDDPRIDLEKLEGIEKELIKYFETVTSQGRMQKIMELFNLITQAKLMLEKDVAMYGEK